MTIFRFSGDSIGCVKYVQGTLRLLGDITEFEVYRDEEDIPDKYWDVPDSFLQNGERVDHGIAYHLVLRDKKGQEVWLRSCKCGYSGSGPNATKEVLQLVGVKIDYERVSREKRIVVKNITPHYDLNFVVFERKGTRHQERRMKVSMVFKTAYEKWEAKKALGVLGETDALSKVEPDKPVNYYFRLMPYATERESAEFATNNALLLKPPFAKMSDKNLEMIIQNIANDHNTTPKFTFYKRQAS